MVRSVDVYTIPGRVRTTRAKDDFAWPWNHDLTSEVDPAIFATPTSVARPRAVVGDIPTLPFGVAR